MILADGMVDMECPFSIYLPLGAPTKLEMRLQRYRTRNHVTNLGMTGLQAREIQTLSKSLNNETQSKTSLASKVVFSYSNIMPLWEWFQTFLQYAMVGFL